jgi:hypothetical protein
LLLLLLLLLSLLLPDAVVAFEAAATLNIRTWLTIRPVAPAPKSGPAPAPPVPLALVVVLVELCTDSLTGNPDEAARRRKMASCTLRSAKPFVVDDKRLKLPK